MTETRKPFYHGSSNEIDGNYLKPRPQWNSVQNRRVVGAFVTSDPDYAKRFAIVNSMQYGQGHHSNKKFYMEGLQKNIKTKLFLYTVHETPGQPFIHDRGSEYYSEKPIKIDTRETFDIVAEIERMGYEIYVLNKRFPANVTSPREKQQLMNVAIANGQYHRVDIAKIIKEQQTKKFKSGKNKIESKLKIWLHKLRDAVSNVFD